MIGVIRTKHVYSSTKLSRRNGIYTCFLIEGEVVELEALPAISPISSFLSEAVVITDLSPKIAVGSSNFDTFDATVVCREINENYTFTGTCHGIASLLTLAAVSIE